MQHYTNHLQIVKNYRVTAILKFSNVTIFSGDIFSSIHLTQKQSQYGISTGMFTLLEFIYLFIVRIHVAVGL